MLTTTHYGLNIVEGTDIVNPLVQQNPNYTAIDTAMFANKQGSIGSGTELTAGTVHTITRANPDSNYVRFTATSNWTAGDSMIVDATPVSVYLSDGTTPLTGAYVINTEVLILVNGSRVTLLASGKQNASQVSFNNTGTGLVATNTQSAIVETLSVANAKPSVAVIDYPITINGSTDETYDVTSEITAVVGNIGNLYSFDVALSYSDRYYNLVVVRKAIGSTARFTVKNEHTGAITNTIRLTLFYAE